MARGKRHTVQPGGGLLFMLLLAAAKISAAAFTETFTSTGKLVFDEAVFPFVWDVKGELTSTNHGPEDPQTARDKARSMAIGSLLGVSKGKVAQTSMLSWDGVNTTLEFFLMIKDQGISSSCPPEVPRVVLSWSTDGTTWQPLWNSSGDWQDTNQWIGVRLALPVSEAAPQFALKWVNTDLGGAGRTPTCTTAYIDDVTFPAKPPTADNLAKGKPAGGLAQDSPQCQQCDHLCGLILAEAALSALSLGRLGGGR